MSAPRRHFLAPGRGFEFGGAALAIGVAFFFAASDGLKYATAFSDTHLGRIGR